MRGRLLSQWNERHHRLPVLGGTRGGSSGVICMAAADLDRSSRHALLLQPVKTAHRQAIRLRRYFFGYDQMDFLMKCTVFLPASSV
jgi:hypothetical protein